MPSCFPRPRVLRLAPVGFGKLVFGLILVGLGALLLAAATGYLPAGVWPWLLRFWPLLLFGFGLALLASAVRNLALGIFASAVVLGCFVFGGYWISRHGDSSKVEHRAAIRLEGTPVRRLTLQGGALAGSYFVAADPSAKRELRLSVSGVAAEKHAAHDWRTGGNVGHLVWPSVGGMDQAGLVGGAFQLGIPEGMPVQLDCGGCFATTVANLAALKPENFEFRAFGSNLELTLGVTRPRLILIHGYFTDTEIHLPPACPARIEYTSPLTMHTFPRDFEEHVSPNVKGRSAYWSAEGPGRPVMIRVEGHFNRIRVVREPLKMVSASTP